MGHTVSATVARVRFGELMRQAAEDPEPIIVERGGKPSVVVLSIAAYERLQAGKPNPTDWRELVRQARAQIRAELNGRELPPSEDVLRQAREERDAQLMALH